ncbi:hypothetical protein NEPAR05_0698 [Nematocida parisii]|uniref:DNA recombination and repair protein Rad51-like C-terminal domain-containing protein n=1 Tax=Nematocida parisii (strain ERTm3) TaxID=935791 RepID=I3EF06_NEMP3|nr:hypothetical protein NEQG_01875 [Nematocida parisii ERTm3]KAI5143561.1 hypothetical protein NEPAR07_0690 [Nematocida parisii]KAI5156583.1 hypothetical protein NEPAR05_0698 [Nematocida parisii]
MRNIIKSSSADVLRNCKLIPIKRNSNYSTDSALLEKRIIKEVLSQEEISDDLMLDGISVQDSTAIDVNSILYDRIEMYNCISCLLLDPVNIEILGGRQAGKTLFLYGLLRANHHLCPQLILTKGSIPVIPGTKIHTATNIRVLITVLEDIINTHSITKTQLLGIDTLITLLIAEKAEERRSEVFFLLKVLNALGVRVIVITSLIETVRKSSDFYDKSLLFKPVMYT